MATTLLPTRADDGFLASPFMSLQREINRLFEEAFHPGLSLFGGTTGEASMMMPRTELRETDKEIRVIAEMPGVAEKEIEVSLDEDILTIRGEKKAERKEERENTYFTERSFGTFQRSLRLPYHVEPDQVKAAFENGVLTVTMPKNKAQERLHKIPIAGPAGKKN